MRRLGGLGLILLAGCASDTTGLLGGTGPDAGAPPDGVEALPDAGPPTGADAGPMSACDEATARLSEDDRPELLALGFRLSATVLEGELGVGRPDDNGRLISPFLVTRAHRGHSAMVGATVQVEVDAVTARAAPATVVLGFDNGGYGYFDDANRHTLGPSLVAAGPVERTMHTGHFPYSGLDVAGAYVVEVRGATDDGLDLFVHETLGGTPARTINLRWSARQPRPPAEVSTARFIASFAFIDVDRSGFASAHLQSVVDWRPDARAARDAVQAALQSPVHPIDRDRVLELAETYARGFTFHRAAQAIRTEVRGLADECCTGAGGTYVLHEVLEAFRGEVGARFQRGGHGYYSDEACGDRRLLATGPLVAPADFDVFGCDPIGGTGDYEPVTLVRAELPDSPANRDLVETWVEAAPPLYTIGSIDRGAPAPVAAGQATPWSQPMPVEQALATGRPVLIEVKAAEVRGDHTWVELETTFSEYDFDHLERHRVALAFRCGDDRLLEVGRRWIVPMVDARWVDVHSDREAAISSGTLLFVPGLLLEAEGPWQRIINRMQSYLRVTNG